MLQAQLRTKPPVQRYRKEIEDVRDLFPSRSSEQQVEDHTRRYDVHRREPTLNDMCVHSSLHIRDGEEDAP